MRFARGAAAKGHQWPARAAVPRAQHESARPCGREAQDLASASTSPRAGRDHADGSQGVQLIGDSDSRLCSKHGTVGKRGNKQPIEGYEFVDKKKRGGGR